MQLVSDECIYVDEFSDHLIEVKYITAHSGYEQEACEISHLPLPPNIKESVAIKAYL